MGKLDMLISQINYQEALLKRLREYNKGKKYADTQAITASLYARLHRYGVPVTSVIFEVIFQYLEPEKDSIRDLKKGAIHLSVQDPGNDTEFFDFLLDHKLRAKNLKFYGIISVRVIPIGAILEL